MLKNDAFILKNLMTAVLLIDGRTNIIFLNEAAEALLQTNKSRAVGQLITDFLFHAESDLNILKNALDNQQSYTKRASFITQGHHQKTYIDFTISPTSAIRPSHSNESDVYFMVEIQTVDRLLRISKEESLQAAEDRSRLLTKGLAHEVKNPLSGIRGAAQLLALELTSSEQKEYTDVIIQEADRLNTLVDRLLGPNLPLKLQQTNVHRVLERVLKVLSAEETATVKVIRDYDPSLPEIEGDFEQLVQAILNIVKNAKQSVLESQTTAPLITIRTRIQRNQTMDSTQHPLSIRLDIIDNGPGIADDFFKEIFYPMITNRPKGTGLGLPIAQSIIHKHKGTIECVSEPESTKFSLNFPVFAHHAAEQTTS